MRFGRFEISEFGMIMLLFIVMIIGMIVSDTTLKVEQERTKQIELQYNKEINNEFKDIE